jgi:poly(3-hydroxybutyrate) depolymerase
MHEFARLAMMPWRGAAEAMRSIVSSPFNPWAQTPWGKQMLAATEVFERITRKYGKPEWMLPHTIIDSEEVAVTVEPVVQRTFCHLLHFRRETTHNHPKLLIVAPLSGHFATLLRGTVEAMLPDHDVYITDWLDARLVPVNSDRFNLNDYIDYVIDFLHYLGPNTHVMAVCQPTVPVLAAVSVMSSWGDLCVPASLTMMGGPVDTRQNPTAVNKLAEDNPYEWFEQNVVTTVPPPYPGVGRKVYPGFIQLTNFISMNFDKHMQSFHELFEHLVQGDLEEADKRRDFYDEYLAVMDLPAEFYLQTIKTVFQEHSLPKGEMIHRWHPVKVSAITRTALLAVEGELDDISGVGQTKAALDLATNVPTEMKHYHLQEKVGHYGIFNGGRWRREIAPVVKQFIRKHDHTNRKLALAS